MNQNLSKKLERIDAEIKRGLKMKAADRLRNLINQYPNELILLERLAELYYQSGFLDAAGKLWILIEPKEKKIIKCVEIYEKSVNYSGTQILNDIMFRGDKNQLSEYGRKKLSLLEKDSQQKSNYIPRFSPKLNKTQRNKLNENQSFFFARLLPFLLLLAMTLVLILTTIGFLTIIGWLF